MGVLLLLLLLLLFAGGTPGFVRTLHFIRTEGSALRIVDEGRGVRGCVRGRGYRSVVIVLSLCCHLIILALQIIGHVSISLQLTLLLTSGRQPLHGTLPKPNIVAI